MVEAPVIFATFARPEYARQTFNAIKNAKPKKFYFYSNKAREDSPDEIERNNQVRSLVDEIDWDCELKTFFRNEYVDIYTSLWGAYDWVFENEEQAIILEEDCVPSLAFFDFCDQLLPKYKDDQRVWVISGNNFIEGYNPNGYDYIFSRFPFMYGWASWRTRWERIERENIPIKEMKQYKLYKQLFVSDYATKNRLRTAEATFNSKAWDYMFHFAINCNGGMGIVPIKNLVSNIGVQGAHNSKASEFFHSRDIGGVEEYPIIKHPPFYVPDFQYDQRFAKIRYKRSLLQIIKRIIHFSK